MECKCLAVPPRTRHAREREYILILLLTFGALTLCLIVKNLSLQYPAVIGDEYYYSILSRYSGDNNTLFEHNRLVVHLPNELYFWIFHSTLLFGDDTYRFAKILNSFFFAAAIFPIYGLSKGVLGHISALLLSTLIIIAPLQSYTAYFTPESCYYLGFWLFAFVFLSNLPHRILNAGILGGVVLGLLTLIKPHALAVLIGANLTLITVALLPEPFELNRWHTIRCLLFLNGAWLATIATLHVVIFGHRDIDILGSFYGGMAGIPISHKLVFAEDLVTGLLDHLAYIAPLFGLPIVVGFLVALGWLRTDASETGSRIRILSVLAIMVCGLALLMTASFAALLGQFGLTGELIRMHGRYYDFGLPLFLITFYAIPTSGGEIRKSLRCGLFACLVLVFAGWKFLASVHPVFHTDYPEVAWVTQPHTLALSIFWPLASLVLFYYAVIGFKERTSYSIYLATAFIVGSALTFSTQHFYDIETQADRAGALVRNIFAGQERDHGLVVGSDGFIVLRCLFGIPANPAGLVVPAGTVVDLRKIGKDIHWVLTFDDYDLRVPLTTLLAFAGLKISQVQTATAAAPAKSSLVTQGRSAPGGRQQTSRLSH